MKKKFYKSRTVWVMGVAFVATLVQDITGQEVIDAKHQAAIITVVGLFLRFVTNEDLDWSV